MKKAVYYFEKEEIRVLLSAFNFKTFKQRVATILSISNNEHNSPEFIFFYPSFLFDKPDPKYLSRIHSFQLL
jgi:hypothetical protein